MLEFRVRVQRKADGLAFLARRLLAVAHLVNLAGFEFVHFPFLFVNLVQNAAFYAGLVFLAGLPAAACAGSAVVFGALFGNLLETLLAFFFEAFPVAKLVFLVACTLQQSTLHHVGEHLLECHLLLFREPERTAQLASDHRFVTENRNNLFFTG